MKLTPPDRWPRQTPTLGSVLDVLQRRIAEIPGIEVNFSQPIRDNVNESISGQQGQIAVKLYGDDLVGAPGPGGEGEGGHLPRPGSG